MSSDGVGNLRFYEPDFVALTTDGTHHLIETKGLEDVNVVNKDRAAHHWCENTTKLTGKPWSYVKVPQKEFESLQPEDLAALLVLGRQTATIPFRTP